MKTTFYKILSMICIAYALGYCRQVKQLTNSNEQLQATIAELSESYRDTLPALNIENLYSELVRNHVKSPDIVLSQALLETGWFTSNLCKNYNNLFGLYDSHEGDFYQFSHWTESCKAYVTLVQYKLNRYECNDYYDFLAKLGYAEDPAYISKVKHIRKRIQRTFREI